MLKTLTILQVISLFSFVIDVFLQKKVYDSLSSKRMNLYYLLFVITVVVISTSFYLGVSPSVIFVVIAALSFIFSSIEYDIKPLKSLLISALYWTFLMITYYIGFKITDSIYDFMFFEGVISQNNYQYISILVEKIILILCFYIYIFLSYKYLYKNKGSWKKYINYLVVPVATNTVYFFILANVMNELKSKNSLGNSNIFILTLLLIVVANFSVLLVIFFNSKNKKQDFYMDMLYKNQEKSRELYHDMKNHIICMKYSDDHKSDEYIEKVELLLDEYSNKFNTGNVILDTLLHEKNTICLQNRIKFICDINFKKCGFIEDEDICTIFSNLLDNAIESCLKIKNKETSIILRGIAIDSLFVVKLTNTTNGKIDSTGDNLNTTKKNKYLHGLGLKSVKRTLDKYDGELVIEYDKDVFSAKILIPIP